MKQSRADRASRQTEQTDRQTDRPADRQTGREAEKAGVDRPSCSTMRSKQYLYRAPQPFGREMRPQCLLIGHWRGLTLRLISFGLRRLTQRAQGEGRQVMGAGVKRWKVMWW